MNLCCPEGQAHVDSGQLPPHHRCDDTQYLQNINVCQPKEGTENAIQTFANRWKLPDKVKFEGGNEEYCKNKAVAMSSLSSKQSRMKVVFENDEQTVFYLERRHEAS